LIRQNIENSSFTIDENSEINKITTDNESPQSLMSTMPFKTDNKVTKLISSSSTLPFASSLSSTSPRKVKNKIKNFHYLNNNSSITQPKRNGTKRTSSSNKDQLLNSSKIFCSQFEDDKKKEELKLKSKSASSTGSSSDQICYI
jgi:hypothetical protein